MVDQAARATERGRAVSADTIIRLASIIVPAIVRMVELLCAGRPGPEKRAVAVEYVQKIEPEAAGDPARVGLMVDAAVAMLNAVEWVDVYGTRFRRAEP